MATVETAVASGATGAAANTFSFTTPAANCVASVAVGTAVVVDVTWRCLTAPANPPLSPTLTDSAGNTYTLDVNAGSTTAPNLVFRSNITNAITSGATTFTATFITNKADEIAISVNQTVGFSLAVSGTPVTVAVTVAALTHSVSFTATNATDHVHVTDVDSGANASTFTSWTNATGVQTVGTPTNRAIASGYYNPGSTASTTITGTWTASHTGSITAIGYVATALTSNTTTMSSTSSLAAAATLTEIAATTMASVNAVTVAAILTALGIVTMASTETLTDATMLTEFAAVTMTSTETFVSDATAGSTSSTTMSSFENFNAAALLTEIAATTMSSTDSVTAAAVRTTLPATTMSSNEAFTAGALRTTLPAVTMASGDLTTVDAVRTTLAAATMSSNEVFNAAGFLTEPGVVSLTSVSTLVAGAGLAETAVAVLSSVHNTTAVAQVVPGGGVLSITVKTGRLTTGWQTGRLTTGWQTGKLTTGWKVGAPQ